jgi:cell division protein FtsW
VSRRARAAATRVKGGPGRRRPARPQPIEQRVLLTATLCLLALGAVMVYSASSARNLLGGYGDGTTYLIRYVLLGALALVGMHLIQRHGYDLARRATPLLLAVSFVLLVLVLTPLGTEVNGAHSWIGPGILSPQPSELMKLSLVLYCAQYLARHPRRIQTLGGMMSPVGLVAGAACLLVLIEPDTGTTLVIAGTVAALLIAAGVPLRQLAIVGAIGLALVVVLVLIQPYQQARLTSFLDPWADKGGNGFQSVQGQIALGSGGLFGVGLGESVQKVFYLPEAHTDFILAVIGEELGLVGVLAVFSLFGMIVWSGLRIARAAADPYAKLLATGLTSLILCQAILNIFVVLGLAPLTGVPLPFVSYGPTNLFVILAAVGLLLSVADRERVGLRLVDPARRGRSSVRRDAAAADRDRRRRDGGARRAGAGGRRRAAG